MPEIENALDASAGGIQGVLFDIDETLVDLKSASIDGFLQMVRADFSHVPPEHSLQVAQDFASDVVGAYDKYMAGELTFLGQRFARVHYAYEQVNLSAPGEEEFPEWARRYEQQVRWRWKPFADVQGLLELLRELDVPFGAVSNNIESYQRDKLRISGIEGFEVVIGSDTAGSPKPSPAPFLTGCRELGTEPKYTLYVGDNPKTDYQAAIEAGLQAVLVDRDALHSSFHGHKVSSLQELVALFLEK